MDGVEMLMQPWRIQMTDLSMDIAGTIPTLKSVEDIVYRIAPVMLYLRKHMNFRIDAISTEIYPHLGLQIGLSFHHHSWQNILYRWILVVIVKQNAFDEVSEIIISQIYPNINLKNPKNVLVLSFF